MKVLFNMYLSSKIFASCCVKLDLQHPETVFYILKFQPISVFIFYFYIIYLVSASKNV